MRPIICIVTALTLLTVGFGCSGQKPEPLAGKKIKNEAAVQKYRDYIQDETSQLVAATEYFVQAVEKNDTAKARALYAPTRMHFERIEPVAESLGDFDAKIDLREKDSDGKNWTGFHVVEKILWTEGANAKALKAAQTLLNDVKSLGESIGKAEINEKLMFTGSIELLNEVSTSKVTGEEEVFSRTDLWDFAANVEGSRVVFDLLKTSFEAENAQNVLLVTQRFDALQKLLEAQKTKTGYRFYNELDPETIKQFVQAIDSLAEPLAYLALSL